MVHKKCKESIQNSEVLGLNSSSFVNAYDHIMLSRVPLKYLYSRVSNSTEINKIITKKTYISNKNQHSEKMI